MSVKFFGQFLIDQGEVDASQVREALDRMEDENPTIGELAVRAGWMTGRQTTAVAAEQRQRDLSFGDLAVELGLLEPAQLVELVRSQRARWLPIGQALVRLGHLESDRLGVLLDAFKADQAPYQAGARELPAALACRPASAYVLDLLPRFLRRVAKIEAKVGEVVAFESAGDGADFRVSVVLRGARSLEVALVCDHAFAEALAVGATGMSPPELDPELIADGVGEFLNVLCGNAVGAVARDGHRVELGHPDYDATLGDGFEVELAVGVGRAGLALSPF